MTRNILDKRLKSLTSELAEMGSLVEKQIYDSIKALKNHDIEYIWQHNHQWHLILERCLQLQKL